VGRRRLGRRHRRGLGVALGLGRSRYGFSRGRLCGFRLGLRTSLGSRFARDDQEGKRVDVPLRLVRAADAEVDVRLERDRVGALADGPDRGALHDRGASSDRDRAELEQRDGVAVLGADRERPAAIGHGARERHDAAGRCPHSGAQGRPDVQAAVLCTRVGIVSERESAEHRPVDGPRPRGCARSPRERYRGDDQANETPHASSFVA
jgi:hypothetical protein